MSYTLPIFRFDLRLKNIRINLNNDMRFTAQYDIIKHAIK
jgi:hypothetical protein